VRCFSITDSIDRVRILPFLYRDDLFELVREQEQGGGGGGAGGAPGLRTMRPAGAESCLWSPPPRPPEVRFEPPSEAQMAAWLCTIVRGEELAGGGRDAYLISIFICIS
jgi:hypothetical protein